MNLERSKDWVTGAKVWTLTIYPREFAAAKFTRGDRLLLDECASADAPISDTFLALELIARRIEEAKVPA